MAPALFPALKEAVRALPRKGQFILSGSVRFTSRKAIRESLTGRIFNLELLPFSIAEAHNRGLPTTLLRFQKMTAERAFEASSRASVQEFDHFLESGGLPGICFQRNISVRSGYFESHLETVLDRDLRLVQQTSLSYPSIRGVLSLLAQNQGMPTDYARMSRDAQVSVLTLKKLISSFESVFLIRRLASMGGTKAPIFFMEDQGIAAHLLRSIGRAPNELHELTRGLFANLFPQFHYRPELAAQVFQYRTRGGARVPFAVRTINGNLGIIPSLGNEPTPQSIGSARSFIKNHQRAKVVIVCRAGKIRIWDKNLVSVPVTAVI